MFCTRKLFLLCKAVHIRQLFAGVCRCIASNPAGEVKSECELKVRPATTQLSALSTVSSSEAPHTEAVPSSLEQSGAQVETIVSSQVTQIGSQDNAKWLQTQKETVTIEKTGGSTTEYEISSGSAAKPRIVDEKTIKDVTEEIIKPERKPQQEKPRLPVKVCYD